MDFLKKRRLLTSATTITVCYYGCRYLIAIYKRYSRDVPPKSVAKDDYRGSWHGYQSIVYRAIDYYFTFPSVQRRSLALAKARTIVPHRFRETLGHQLRDISLVPMSKLHTHPNAASLRTSVAIAFENTITQAGLTPYSVSKSARDKYDGSRFFYFPKDLDKPYSNPPVTKDHVFIFIDVDYYVDINEYLKFGNPMLLYTFVPLAPAGATSDAVYSISDNWVHYRIGGGATYRHRVWNYHGDTVCVIDADYNLIVFDIEQYQLESDPCRRVIGFYPKAIIPYPYYKYLDIELGFQYRDFGTTVNCIVDDRARTISVSKKGSDNSVTLPSYLFEALLVRHRTSAKPVIADVERLLRAEQVDRPSTSAPILFDLLQEYNVKPTVATTSIPCSKHHSQSLCPLTNEDGRESGRAVANSLVTDPSVFPTRSHNNEHASVSMRVTAVANDKTPPVCYTRWAHDFVQALVPNPGVGVPYTYEDVIADQSRPSQRARSAVALPSLTLGIPNRCSTFTKLEPGGIGPPRNITTVDTSHTLAFGGFLLAFKYDCLANKPWYAPGLKPREVSQRIQDISVAFKGCIIGDFSKCDGTISRWMKMNIQRPMMLRHFAACYRTDLMHHLREEDTPNAFTRTGIKYHKGFSQGSGSRTTTDWTTVIALAHIYFALRLLGLTHDGAWALLETICIVGGDDTVDGLYPGLDVTLQQAARDLGMSYKVRKAPIGDNVDFYGRYWCDPSISLDSLQDPWRTLSKLHLTAAPEGTPDEQALVNRCSGYLVTDPNTPIIGPWCRQVLRLSSLTPSAEQMTHEEQFKHERGSWIQDDPDLIRATFCALTDLLDSEVTAVEDMIRACSTIADLPEAILNNEHTIAIKMTSVISGNIVHAEPNIEKCHSATKTVSISHVPGQGGKVKSFPTFPRQFSQQSKDDNTSSQPVHSKPVTCQPLMNLSPNSSHSSRAMPQISQGQTYNHARHQSTTSPSPAQAKACKTNSSRRRRRPTRATTPTPKPSQQQEDAITRNDEALACGRELP